jgi:hypothetical protein
MALAHEERVRMLTLPVFAAVGREERVRVLTSQVRNAVPLVGYRLHDRFMDDCGAWEWWTRRSQAS